MPRYVTVTPKYNPTSIDEYLKVPMLIASEYKEEEKKLDEQQDKLSYVRTLLGDQAGDTFKDYDALMESIKDNPSVQNMKRNGKQLKGMYRDIINRAEIAKENRDRVQKKFDKDPTLVGDIGTFADYYNNPNYNPSTISGGELEKAVTTWATQKAQQATPRFVDYLDHDKSQMIYMTGYNDNELATIMVDATSGNPQTTEGKELGTILDQYGYNSASQQDKKALTKYITKGMSVASARVSTSKDPEYRNASQRIADQLSNLQLEEAKRNMEETGHMKVSKKDSRWSPYTLDVTEELKQRHAGEFKTAYPDGKVPSEISVRRIVHGNGNVTYELPGGVQFTEKGAGYGTGSSTPTTMYMLYDPDTKKYTPLSEEQAKSQIVGGNYINPEAFKSETSRDASSNTTYYKTADGTYILETPYKGLLLSSIMPASTTSTTSDITGTQKTVPTVNVNKGI